MVCRARARFRGEFPPPPPFDRTFDIAAGVTACPVFIRENSAILTDSRLSRDDALISVSHPRRLVSRSERRPPRPLYRPPAPSRTCVFCYDAPTRTLNARSSPRFPRGGGRIRSLSAMSLVHVPAKGPRWSLAATSGRGSPLNIRTIVFHSGGRSWNVV